MSELRFRILGVTGGRADRWRDRAQSGHDHVELRTRIADAWNALSRPARLCLLAAAGLAVVYYASPVVSPQDVRGRRILLLLDVSASMGDTTERTNNQLATLKANNISVTSPVPTPGFAISAMHDGYSMLQPLEEGLAHNPQVDTVYFISDFKNSDETDNDAAGYERLRELVRSRGLTLYFCTVDQPLPPSQYQQILQESGGGLIEDFKKTQ